MTDAADEARRSAWRQARPAGPVASLDVDAQGWEVGTDVVDTAVDSGAGVLLLCDPRPVSQAARAVAALLCATDAAAAMHRGGDDLTWMRECAAVRDAMARLRPQLGDVARLTAADAALAAQTAMIVRAAARRTPVVLSGTLPEIAAVAAQRVASNCSGWVSTALAQSDPAAALARRRSGSEPWGAVEWVPGPETLDRLVRALVADLDGGSVDPD